MQWPQFAMIVLLVIKAVAVFRSADENMDSFLVWRLSASLLFAWVLYMGGFWS